MPTKDFCTIGNEIVNDKISELTSDVEKNSQSIEDIQKVEHYNDIVELTYNGVRVGSKAVKEGGFIQIYIEITFTGDITERKFVLGTLKDVPRSDFISGLSGVRAKGTINSSGVIDVMIDSLEDGTANKKIGLGGVYHAKKE